MEGFLELTTTENSKVWIKKEALGGIEEVLATSRAEGFCKVYAEGFEFKIKVSLDELKELLS